MTGTIEQAPGEDAQAERRRRAAIELVSGSPTAFRRTARRFSICADDADDAYQRGLEILLTKAPTDDPQQLRPWLHTVIKHEALAVRRQRERLMGAELGDVETTCGPEEQAPARERVHHTAEALSALKRSELQCMLLKALGYSYDEIAERTGYSWTKVNRSLTEGRRSFFDRFEEVASGASCERARLLIDAERDGLATEQQRQQLRTHLRGCGGCRAELRERRAVTSRFGLISPVLLLGALRGSWWERAQASVGGSLSAKLAQLTELVGSHKVAAVAASTAAIAGGVAVEHQVGGNAHRASTHAPRVQPVAKRSTGPAVGTRDGRPDVLRPRPNRARGDARGEAPRQPGRDVLSRDAEFAPSPAIPSNPAPRRASDMVEPESKSTDQVAPTADLPQPQEEMEFTP